VRLWIELSGEHQTLPRAEALASFEAERVRVREVSWSPKVLGLEATGPVLRATSRLGLAHFVCEELVRGSFEDLRAFARSFELGGKTFRTRVQPLSVDLDVAAVEGALGADFGRSGRVDLTSPAVEFRVLVGDDFFLGRVVHRVDRSGLEARKVTHRTFSLPVSLHPKLARALVNLSRVPTAGTLVDPFCGTGGIVLEASRMGLHPVGSDMRRTMVTGARRSLHALGENAVFLIADAGRGPWRGGRLDGIATDPPYGRASSTCGEQVLDLYDRAFAEFAEALQRGRFAAVVLPSESAVEVGARHLELVERHALRVHRSLTRNFCVFLR
jgi:tRNA (guanine10-N2)-dimethyltransferase